MPLPPTCVTYSVKLYYYAVAIRPAAGHNFIALFVRHFLCAHVKAQVSVRYTKSVYLRGINLGLVKRKHLLLQFRVQ